MSLKNTVLPEDAALPYSCTFRDESGKIFEQDENGKVRESNEYCFIRLQLPCFAVRVVGQNTVEVALKRADYPRFTPEYCEHLGKVMGEDRAHEFIEEHEDKLTRAELLSRIT